MEAHNKKSGMNAESGRRRVGPDAQAGSRRHRAFTLIEIVGVLAVIAILTCILIPVVFEAIHNARINASATSVATAKTACVEHFAKFGSLSVDGTVSPVSPIALDGSDTRSSDFDLVLLQENLLDKPLAVPIGFAYAEIVPALASDEQADGVNSVYDLDGRGTRNDAAGGTVAEAVIIDVSLEDARALNNLIDGVALAEDNGGNDFKGRVKYAKPGPSNNGNGNGNANANASANGNGNGNGSGNGNGNGNGNSNGAGNGNGARGNGKAWAWGHHRDNSVDVHIYLTHR